MIGPVLATSFAQIGAARQIATRTTKSDAERQRHAVAAQPAQRQTPRPLARCARARGGVGYFRQNWVQSFFHTGCTPAQFSKSIRSEKNEVAFS